ncbi:hypothetical protein C0558_21680 [Serratia marcescens]|nr:hypothetical protein C0558_21680 [Serratia marcescens]ODJ15146.1 hypothetical protein BBC05_15535 [Serratia sp. ISTD04]
MRYGGEREVGKANRLIGGKGAGCQGPRLRPLARSKRMSFMAHLTFIDRKLHKYVQKNAN